MACVNPDGTLTDSAKQILNALQTKNTPEDVASITGLPLFRVRSALRDLVDSGFVNKVGDEFQLTDKGVNHLK